MSQSHTDVFRLYNTHNNGISNAISNDDTVHVIPRNLIVPNYDDGMGLKNRRNVFELQWQNIGPRDAESDCNLLSNTRQMPLGLVAVTVDSTRGIRTCLRYYSLIHSLHNELIRRRRDL